MTLERRALLLVAAALVAQTWAMGRAVAALDLGLVASYALWTRRRSSPLPGRAVPALLAALVVQSIHLAEEYRAGFPQAFPALFGYSWSDARFLAFNAVWLVVFTLSAAAVARGRRLGALGATFLGLGGGVLNGLGHVALAARAGGYFPGLYTAPLCLAAGLVLLARLAEPPRHGARAG